MVFSSSVIQLTGNHYQKGKKEKLKFSFFYIYRQVTNIYKNEMLMLPRFRVCSTSNIFQIYFSYLC